SLWSRTSACLPSVRHGREPHPGLKPLDPDVSSGMSSLREAVVDPKADEIQRLATLVGPDGNRARAIVQAFGPLVLPLGGKTKVCTPWQGPAAAGPMSLGPALHTFARFPRLPESRLAPRLQTACKSSLIFRPVRDRPPLHPHTPPQARFKEMSIAGSPPASSLAEVSFARNRRPPDCPHPY